MNRSRVLACGAAACAIAVASLAFAQDGVTSIEQITPAQAAASRPVASQVPGEREQALAPARQLSRTGAPPTPPSQLTREAGTTAGSPQLNRERPSTAGTTALSSPAQGRNTAVTRVAGADRCDPGTAPAQLAAECAGVLESRAAEFERPVVQADTRSPEERLLSLRRMEAAPDARLAARRLAEGEVDDSLAAQAVASGELARRDDGEAVAASAQAEEQTAAAALVHAIINSLAARQGN